MNNLKNQIFALLKKCPNGVDRHRISYHKDDNYYDLTLNKKYETQEDTPNFSASLIIYKNTNKYFKSVELTEKEYMDIKWSIEEWNKVLEDKAFEEFRDFVESTPNSMDDLLKDD